MNLQKMMKQAQDMQNKLAQAQAEAESQEHEGASGGGMVKIRINGKGRALKVTLDQSVMDDREMLEDLIVAAINDAEDKKNASFTDSMGKITAGLPLPPGFKLPF